MKTNKGTFPKVVEKGTKQEHFIRSLIRFIGNKLHAGHKEADKTCSLLLTQDMNVMQISCHHQEFIVVN